MWRFTLTLASVTPAQTADYSVVVSNMVNVVTSQVAQLEVYVPPAIAQNPTNITTVVGSNVTLSVTASGIPAPSYQWRKGGIAQSGQTASTLAFTGITTGEAGSYDVVITNAAGAVTSSVAVVTVNVPITITGQPQGLIRTNGDTAVFTVTATGTSPAYQW